MHRSHLSILSAAAIALTLQTAAAVSLDDFTPRASNLPSACQTLYSSDIDGCEASDFTGGKCSSSCISALTTLTQSVKKSCAGDVSGDNILNAMINNQGISRICPNAGSDDVPSSTSSSISSTSTKTTETDSIGSGTMILGSSSLSTSGLLVDTSKPTATQSSAAMKTTTAGTTLTVAPVQASSTSDSNAGILHDATTGATSLTEATPSPTSTNSSKSAQETSDSGNGSPFDSTSDSTQLSLPLLSSLSAFLLGVLLVR